jgi:hypothetical protein
VKRIVWHAFVPGHYGFHITCSHLSDTNNTSNHSSCNTDIWEISLVQLHRQKEEMRETYIFQQFHYPVPLGTLGYDLVFLIILLRSRVFSSFKHWGNWSSEELRNFLSNDQQNWILTQVYIHSVISSCLALRERCKPLASHFYFTINDVLTSYLSAMELFR